MATVFLGLGSNLGNREENIRAAIEALSRQGIVAEKISSIIETDPIGGPPQGKFLNAVLKATTALKPEQLLERTLLIEKNLGRVRTLRNAPRTIDIDILLYDEIKYHSPQLDIPHPRMRERNFVMRPLREIEPAIDQWIPT